MRHGVLEKDVKSIEVCKLADQSMRNLNQLHQNQVFFSSVKVS